MAALAGGYLKARREVEMLQQKAVEKRRERYRFLLKKARYCVKLHFYRYFSCVSVIEITCARKWGAARTYTMMPAETVP